MSFFFLALFGAWFGSTLVSCVPPPLRVSYTTFPRRSPCNFVCPSHYLAVLRCVFFAGTRATSTKGCSCVVKSASNERIRKCDGTDQLTVGGSEQRGREQSVSFACTACIVEFQAQWKTMHCKPPSFAAEKDARLVVHASLPNAGGVLLSLDGAPGLFGR